MVALSYVKGNTSSRRNVIGGDVKIRVDRFTKLVYESNAALVRLVSRLSSCGGGKNCDRSS